MHATRVSSLTFDDLSNRLLRHLADLIHSGETTERRLAGQIYISQPHLHNILSGTRKLTPAVADQALYYLDWSLLDLLESTEATALLSRRETALTRGRYIDFAHSAIGQGFRLPGCPDEEVAVPFSWLAHTDLPLAVRANADPEMDAVIEAGDTLLIDRGAAARDSLDPDALYVIRLDDQSLARWIRFATGGIYVFSAINATSPIDWPLIATDAENRCHLIEGKIIAIAQPLDRKFRRPDPPSAFS